MNTITTSAAVRDDDVIKFFKDTVPIYFMYKSIGIVLHPTYTDEHIIEFNIKAPALKLRAAVRDIRAKNWTAPFKGNGQGFLTDQLQHLYPIHLWEVVEGDPNWWKEIYIIRNWKLPKGDTHASA